MPSPTSSSSPRAVWKRVLPYAILLLLPMLLLWRVVFLGEAFVPASLLKDIYPWGDPNKPLYPWNPIMWDGIAQFYPWRLFASSIVHAGFLPLWNPHEFCGTPFAANSQSAIYYPLNAIFVILPVKAAFGASVILHLFLTGSFLYLLLRRSMSLAHGPALIGAITWQLCTWQVSWLELPTFLCVSTWIPAALLSIDELRRGTKLASLALGLSLGLMILAGHLQICLYGFMLIAAYGIFRLVPVLKQDARRILGAVGIALSITLLLGLAQVLPAVELSRMSHRAGGHPTTSGYAMYVSIAAPAFQLITLAIPGFFGNPTDGTYNLQQPQFYAEGACYVGLAGFLLAIAAVVSTWRAQSSTRFFAVTALLSILLAIGTPLDALFYFGIPGFAESGSPGRILVLWSLCMAILAAVGAQALVHVEGVKRRQALTASAVGLVVVVVIGLASMAARVGAASAFGIVAQQFQTITDLWRVPLVVLLATVGVLYQFSRHKMTRVQTSALLAVIVAVDLLASNLSYNRTARFDDVYPVTPSIAYLQQNAGLERVMPVNREWTLDPAHPPHAVLPPNAATVYGLYDTQGYDSLFPGQYIRFAGEVNDDGRSAAPLENGNMVFTRGLSSTAAQALSPAYVMAIGDTPLPQPLSPPGKGEPELSEAVVDGDITVYRNSASLPRFSLTQAGTTAVAAVAPAPTRIDITAPVAAGVPASLLVRDQWYPGWKATIDGQEVAIDEAPFIFRTLRWTPATSAVAHVSLRFQPTTTFAGIYFLCLGWLTAAGALACSKAGRPARH